MFITREKGLPISKKKEGFEPRMLFGKRFSAYPPDDEEDEEKRSLFPSICIHINVQK